MPSKKDPNSLISGTGSAGSKSVGANALTFEPENGVPPTLYLDDLFVTDVNATDVNTTNVTATGSLSGDTITVRLATVTEDLNSLAGTITTFDSTTGTITTLDSTDFTVSTIAASTSIDAPTVTATDTNEGVRTYTISRADGDSASDITVIANLVLEDTAFALYRDVTAGDVISKGSVKTDEISPESGTEVEVTKDIVGSGTMTGNRLSLTSTSTQRFPNLTEAFDYLEIGEMGVVETYDPTKELGASNFELFGNGEDWGQAGYDGHLIYTVNSEGIAVAKSREDGSTVQTFTLQNAFADGTSLKAASNGDKVIFAYSHNGASEYGIEVYDVETGNFLFPLTTETEVFAIAMNHEAAFIIKSSGATSRQLVKYSLNTGALEWASGSSSMPLYQSVSVKGTTVIATAPTEIKVFSYTDGGSLSSTISRVFGLDYVEILDSFFDDSYFYLSLENAENRYETIVYEISEVDQSSGSIQGDSSIQGMRKLWEKISDVPMKITSDHRNFYVLEGLEVTSFDKKSFKKEGSFEIDNTANLTINQFQADGQSLIVGGQYTVPSSGSFFLNLYLDLDPSLFLKIDPVSTRERIYYHHLIPFSEEKYREPTVRKFGNLTKAYEDMVIGETGLVETYQNEREFGYVKWNRNAAGAASDPTNATASDGRYIYILSSSGVAKAVDRETGADVHTYTFTNVFDDTGTFHIATNGKYVAFSFNDILEIFEVDSPVTPVITFSDDNGLDIKSLWMNHEAVFRVQQILTTKRIRKTPLDGSPETSGGTGTVTSVTGYGNFLLESFDSGSGLEMRLRDANTFAIIGSSIVINSVEPSTSDISIDGSYIYIGQDSSGIGGIAAYPLTRDGVGNSFRVWSSITGENNTHIAIDHRYIYTADDSLTLRLYDKATLVVKETLDISAELSDATGIVGLIADGDSVFVSVSTAGNSSNTTARYHMDLDPTLFVKVDPSHPRGKLFYHHLVPAQGEDKALSRINSRQQISRPVNLFRHKSRDSTDPATEWELDPVNNQIQTPLFDSNDSLVLTYENSQEGTLDSLNVTFSHDSGFDETLDFNIHIRNPVTSANRTTVLSFLVPGTGTLTDLTETINESVGPNEYIILELTTAGGQSNLRIRDLYLNLTAKE